MKKAIAYVRFSSEEQADGDSIKRQTSNTSRYAERYGFAIEKTFVDEGKSAFKGHHLSNGELGKFLTEADKGNYRGYAFLVEEQDRLSRQGIMATFAVIGRLLEAGIEIHVTEKNLAIRSFKDLDNLAISVPTIVNGSAANEYSEKLSARVSSARSSEREKARATGLAITAKAPSWIRAEMGKKAVAIPEHAATVRRIFELAIFGLGCKKIVRKLEEEGRAPFIPGHAWNPGFIQNVLCSRAVLGEYLPHKLVNGRRVPVGEPIPDYYPAIITQSEWNAARAAVKAKTRFVRKDGKPGFAGGRTNVNSLLSPLVYDADNGVTMVFLQKQGDHPYLVSKWQSRKKAHFLRLDKFESAFLGFLEDLDWKSVAGEGESEEVKKAVAELDAVLREIDRCTGKIARMQDLVNEGSFSRSLFEALDGERAKLRDYASRKEKLAAALAEVRSNAAALHAPEELVEAIRSGKNPELRLKLKAEIRKRISRIDICFDQTEIDDPRDRLDYFCYVKFANDVPRAIGVKDSKALLFKITGDLKMLDELDRERAATS
jgi:DNA invertase Pin-like site-specific DNA recombinase